MTAWAAGRGAQIRPILDLPADRQVSWIKKRLDRFAAMLRAGVYRGSSMAGDLYEVSRHDTRAEADSTAAVMEARGHKQAYWVARSA